MGGMLFLHLALHSTESSRFLVERGNREAARPLFALAEKICRERPEEMMSTLADVIFCHSSIGAETNDNPKRILAFATEHLELRTQLYAQRKSEYLTTMLSTAEGELGLACMINNMHEEALVHCARSKALRNEPLPGDATGEDDIAIFPRIHETYSLIALGRVSEAERGITEILAFRKRVYKQPDSSYV